MALDTQIADMYYTSMLHEVGSNTDTDVARTRRERDTYTMNDDRTFLTEKRLVLLSRLSELDARMAKLTAEYTRSQQEISTERQPLAEALSHVEALMALEGFPVPCRDASSADSDAKTPVLDAAVRVLEGQGREMHYRDIAGALQTLDHDIPGRDPAATLLTRMSRDPRFRRGTARGTYALATWPAQRTLHRHQPKGTRRSRAR